MEKTGVNGRTVSVLARHLAGMDAIPLPKQKEIMTEVYELLLFHDNTYIRNELYKMFRVPPFVLTHENEVVFTGECELYDLD